MANGAVGCGNSALIITENTTPRESNSPTTADAWDVIPWIVGYVWHMRHLHWSPYRVCVLCYPLCCDSSWFEIGGRNNKLLRGGVVWASQQVTLIPILFLIFLICLVRSTNPLGRFQTGSLQCNVSAGRMIAFSRLSVFLTVNQFF